MSGTDFNAPEFNVDNANTSVSGEFFEGGLQQLDDASNNLTLYVSKEIMNQIFLFYSDDTSGGSTESNDLSDFSNTDMKYALNVQQWNIKLETTKEERKHVITNLLMDLFGGGASEALRNIDVFSNEEALDSDISAIFHTRASAQQRINLSDTKHGYFTHNASLSSVNHQKIIDASSSDYDALTRQLLETATVAAQSDPNNTILRRQFDTTNTSNVDYNLPTGWRTFQFIDGDTFSYNLSIKQLSTFFPAWSVNQNALTGDSLPTSYRVKLLICEEPSGQTGIFITPGITINQVDTVNASTAFNNVITTNITSTTVQTSDITASTILSADANILFETTITVANVIFANLSETEKTNITQQIKELYAQELNVNTESILITLSDGSLIINVKVYNVLLTGITLIGSSTVQAYQFSTYNDLGATALNNGVDVTNTISTTSTVDTSVLGTYSVSYSVPGTSLTATRTVVVIEDTVAPTIQLVGESTITINQSEANTYNDAGAYIIDNDISLGVATSDITDFDLTVPGVYTITYSGQDGAGNSAPTVSRTVTVLDNVAPTLQLLGDATVIITTAQTFDDPGANIIDNGATIGTADSDINSFDLSVEGNYTITYSGTDAAGNNATPVTRTVIVESGTPQFVQKGDPIIGEAAHDESGYSVALSSDGTILAVGAVGDDGKGFNAGHVRVYEWSGVSWTQLGADIDGEAAHDNSGRSVALSSDGTILAVGATGNDGTGSDEGHVRVYQWSSGVWTQLGADIDGDAAHDWSGYSVALSSDGTILAVGAIGNDNGNGTDSGHVRVYQFSSGVWSQLGADIDGEAASDQSGYSVSLSSDGTILAVGASGNDGTSSDEGHVRVYQWSSGSWTQLGADIDGEEAYDWSGWSVSLSSDGTILAVGAVGDDGAGNNAGHVRVYQWSDGAWTQLGADIDGEAAGDRFGFSVALNDAGDRLAASGEFNNAGGYQRGHVRAFKWTGTAWTQTFGDIDGETDEDRFGRAVALNSTGKVLAVGAPFYDGSPGANSGYVKAFDLTY